MKIGITFDLKQPNPAGELPDDWQEEFDSPYTIEAIAEALRGLGHEITLLGDGRTLIERLLADPPELIFNFAEGEGVSRCREARVPALLEMLGIPYTGSDPLCLAVTLDKDVARRLVASHGVPVSPGFVVAPELQWMRANELSLQPVNSPSGNSMQQATLGGSISSWNTDRIPFLSRRVELSSLLEAHGVRFPVIVKPAWEGSSKGIRRSSLAHNLDDLTQTIQQIHRLYRQPALIEEYIAGEELTVGVLGNAPPRVLGTMRVLPSEPTEHFIYSVEVKRDYRRRVHYESPPQLPAEVLGRVEEAALRAFHALGCRDVCRLDFRLRDGVPYFLEANPLPGLHPEDSDLVILARLNGWSYSQLIEAILQAALARIQIHQAQPVTGLTTSTG